MICLILPVYIIGAVIFWTSYKSESLKRDFLLGLAWPVVVPINLADLAVGRIFSVLEEWRAERVQAQARHEAELRGQEERFISYTRAGAAGWLAEEEDTAGKEDVGRSGWNPDSGGSTRPDEDEREQDETVFDNH